MMGKKPFMLYLSVLMLGMGLAPVAQANLFDDVSDGSIFQNPNDVSLHIYTPPSGYDYDPNKFMVDNPHWTPAPLYCEPAGSQIGAAYGRLRLSGIEFSFPDLDVVYMGAAPVDDDTDPNTSPRIFDNSGSSYFLVNVRSHDDNWDPGNGMIAAWTLGDMLGNQTAYDFEMQLNEGWSAIRSYYGPKWIDLDQAQPYHDGYPQYLWDPNSPFDPDVDPNWWGNPSHPTYDANYADPNYGGWENHYEYRKDTVLPMDPMVIRWMLVQLDVNGENHDPNHPDDPNDPNCHWIRGTAWIGGKYDWDGQWVCQSNVIGGMLGNEIWDDVNGNEDPFDPNDPNHWIYHQTDGYVSVAAYSGGNAIQPNEPDYVVDTSYDEMEGRWGEFTGDSQTLTLEVSHPENGMVELHPDNYDDPNNQPYFLHWAKYGTSSDPNFDWKDASTWSDANDPNSWVGTWPPDPNELRRYTPGTEVMLVATPDPNGKGFNKWEVTDPADSNNNYSDTNLVLYLTMDRDWEVKAKFACGSAALMPILGLTLVALFVGVIVRRFS